MNHIGQMILILQVIFDHLVQHLLPITLIEAHANNVELSRMSNLINCRR